MPITAQQNQQLGTLWKNLDSRQQSTIAHKGSIISFHYVGQRVGKMIHDPYPLLLVSDIYSDAIRGVNLNYLTVPYVKSMISKFLEKPFAYALIKGDNYVTGAFRTYKRTGISQLRIMDSDFLRGVAAVSRTLAPNELDQIRMQVEEMLKYQINQPTAQPGEIQRPA